MQVALGLLPVSLSRSLSLSLFFLFLFLGDPQAHQQQTRAHKAQLHSDSNCLLGLRLLGLTVTTPLSPRFTRLRLLTSTNSLTHLTQAPSLQPLSRPRPSPSRLHSLPSRPSPSSPFSCHFSSG
ncbi:hypothetical protein IE53DRAFT_64231 [Violaceomyces palustris]|uniref:Uncharacterized protein n=1 Tax=Violaceomyces palustris TaxID=1673888 RepID=A0ACD0NZ57_9BASI|nr:hypothetical protein IE53DRAFT_64231 [Violaceomyces palustris]